MHRAAIDSGAVAGVRGSPRARWSRWHGLHWGCCPGSARSPVRRNTARRMSAPLRQRLPRCTITRATRPLSRAVRVTRPITIVSSARCSSIWHAAFPPRSRRRRFPWNPVARFSHPRTSNRSWRLASPRFRQPAARPSPARKAVHFGSSDCRALSPPVRGRSPIAVAPALPSRAAPRQSHGEFCNDFVAGIFRAPTGHRLA